MASFFEVTPFLEASWDMLATMLERDHEQSPPHIQTSAIEDESGVRVDHLQALKNGSFRAVFLLNVVDSKYPGDPHLSRLFPTERVVQMPDYPEVTEVDDEDVARTFPMDSTEAGEPFRRYHAEHSRRLLAAGADAANERVYFCFYEQEGAGLMERAQPSRFLTEVYRVLPWLSPVEDTEIRSEQAAEEYLLSRVGRTLEDVRRANSQKVSVSPDAAERELVTIQELLDASGERGEQFAMPCAHGSTSPKGGSGVSDAEFLSPSRLATYATCQRQVYYDYELEVDAPNRTELYLNQGTAYHETIEDICEATGPDDEPEEIYRRALDAFETRWNENLDPDEYASRARQEYQKAENRAAIEAFFNPDGGTGIEHARQSIATEEWVRSVHDGIGLWGKVDNILRTENGLHCIDYKRNLGGVISPNTAEQLVDHHEGVDHAGQKLKNAFQTATYVEGVRASEYSEEGMSVRFSFFGLLNRKDHTRTADG
jgi:putative RecB family exonuclease